jgi:hypothetical protein
MSPELQALIAPADVPMAPPQTPWLLLAFGSGIIARGGSGEGDTERLREPGRDDVQAGAGSPDPSTDTGSGLRSGVAAVPGAMPDQMAVLSAGTSPPPDLASAGTAVPTTQPFLSTATTSTGEGPQEDQAVPGTPWIVGGDVASRQDLPPRRDLTPVDSAALQTEGVSTETRERLQAVILGVSGPALADSPPPPTGVPTATVPGAPPAAARAATLLAHALGQSGPAGDVVRTDALHSVAREGLASVPGTGQSPVRATEALLRFSQSGLGSSRAARDADGVVPTGVGVAPSPVLAQVPSPAPAPAALAAPLPQATGDHVLHQVVASLKMQWKDGIGEAKLHLRPDALGAVSVSLRVEAGAVTAVVRAESPQVQEWVVQHQQTLRQQMEAAGLRLDELVVTPDGQSQSGHEKEAPPEQRRRQPAAPATDAPIFEQLL